MKFHYVVFYILFEPSTCTTFTTLTTTTFPTATVADITLLRVPLCASVAVTCQQQAQKKKKKKKKKKNMSEVSYWGPGEFVNVVCGRHLVASRLSFAYARHDMERNLLWIDGAVAVDGVDCAITFDTVFHAYDNPYAPCVDVVEEIDDNSDSEAEQSDSEKINE